MYFKIPREFMKGSAAENLSIYMIQITLEACYSNDDIKSSLEFDNHDCAFGIVTAADLQKVLITCGCGTTRIQVIQFVSSRLGA